MTIGVYDGSTGTIIVNAQCYYSISISTTAAISGITSGLTSTGGLLTLSDLSIAAAGTYAITATSLGIDEAMTDSFTLFGGPYSISLVTSNAYPLVNCPFTIYATLKRSDQNLYTGAVDITLVNSYLSGTLTEPNSAGTATITVQLTQSGSTTIIASSSVGIATSSIVENALNAFLKITSFSPIVKSI